MLASSISLFKTLTINKKTVNIARLVHLIVFHTIMHQADYLTCIKHFYCTILIHTLKIKAREDDGKKTSVKLIDEKLREKKSIIKVFI
jgi:predicted ATPase